MKVHVYSSSDDNGAGGWLYCIGAVGVFETETETETDRESESVGGVKKIEKFEM